MAAGDVLVTITDGLTRGLPAAEPITVARLEPVAGPRVPHGHSLATGSFCFGKRCLGVVVDFGSASPREAEVRAVDAALASLAVEG